MLLMYATPSRSTLVLVAVNTSERYASNSAGVMPCTWFSIAMAPSANAARTEASVKNDDAAASALHCTWVGSFSESKPEASTALLGPAARTPISSLQQG
jgi:hypothetical protein